MNKSINDNILSLIERTPNAIIRGIAGRVRERRLEQNLTQIDLARRSDMSSASYRRFEQTGQIALHSLVNIAVVMNMSEEFTRLFAERRYRSLDEVINGSKKRQRAKKIKNE